MLILLIIVFHITPYCENNKVTEEYVPLSSAVCFLQLFCHLLQFQQKARENIFGQQQTPVIH